MGGPHQKSDAKRVGKPFPKGVSGNPGGRPKGFVAAIKAVVGDDPTELAQIALAIARGELSIDAVKVMKMGSAQTGDETIVNHPIVEVPNFDQRLAAITFLRDSGWGKPPQRIEVSEVEQKAAEFARMSRDELAAAIAEAVKPPEETIQ